MIRNNNENNINNYNNNNNNNNNNNEHTDITIDMNIHGYKFHNMNM